MVAALEGSSEPFFVELAAELLPIRETTSNGLLVLELLDLVRHVVALRLHVGAHLVEGRGRDQVALAVDLPRDRRVPAATQPSARRKQRQRFYAHGAELVVARGAGRRADVLGDVDVEKNEACGRDRRFEKKRVEYRLPRMLIKSGDLTHTLSLASFGDTCMSTYCSIRRRDLTNVLACVLRGHLHVKIRYYS